MENGTSSPWISADTLAATRKKSPQTTPSKLRLHSGIRFLGNEKKSTTQKPFTFQQRLAGTGKAKAKTSSEKEKLAVKSSIGCFPRVDEGGVTHTRELPRDLAAQVAAAPRTPEGGRRTVRSLGSGAGSGAVQRTPSTRGTPKSSTPVVHRRSEIPRPIVQRHSQSDADGVAAKSAIPGPSKRKDPSPVTEKDISPKEENTVDGSHSAASEPPQYENDVQNRFQDEFHEVQSEVLQYVTIRHLDVPTIEMNAENSEEEQDITDEVFAEAGAPLDRTFVRSDELLQALQEPQPRASGDLQVLTEQSSEDAGGQRVVVTLTAPAAVKATISINLQKSKRLPAAHSGLRFKGVTKKQTVPQPFNLSTGTKAKE